MPTGNLLLTEMVEGQQGATLIFNQVVNVLDALLQMSVKDRGLNTPASTPAKGDRYLVGSSPTGAWATKAGKLAVYVSGWVFVTPKAGWSVYVEDEDILIVYDGTYWVEFGSISEPVQTLSATGTVNLTARIVRVSTTSGDVTATLPTAVGRLNKEYVIKNTGANDLTVEADGTELIDGSASVVCAGLWSGVHVISDGANWLIVAKTP